MQHDKTPPPDRRHRRTVLRVIVVTQLCLALITGLAVALVYRQLDSDLPEGTKIAHVAPSPSPSPSISESQPQRPLNILVMGSDTRAGAGNAIDSQAADGGERSDTTILVHVSADRQEAYGVSLPRDALVDRPMCRNTDGDDVPAERLAMFNSAFALGGPTCTVQTVEKLTGIYIDHFLTLDFGGFVEMVDAIGGVTVCIPQEVDDPAHDIYLPAGVQNLDGPQALNYVRERTVLSVNSDIGRMKRQQAFVASMANKVISANTLSQPNRVYGFLRAVIGSIETDDELDNIGSLFDLAMQFRQTGLADIKFVTVPFEAYEPDPNRLVWTPAADELWKRIIADEPLPQQLRNEVISAKDPVGTPSGSPSPGSAPDEEKQAEARANGLCV